MNEGAPKNEVEKEREAIDVLLRALIDRSNDPIDMDQIKEDLNRIEYYFRVLKEVQEKQS